jgi:spore maturation protein CgeB
MIAKEILVKDWAKKHNVQMGIPYLDLALEGFFDTVVLEDIEMVFVIRGVVPEKLYLDKLKKLGVMTVLYSTEDPYEYASTKEFAPNYDFIFSNDKSGERLYKNCKWIPVAGDDKTFYPTTNTKLYDICFIGTFFKERILFFEKCLDFLKDKKNYFAGHWVYNKINNTLDTAFGDTFGVSPSHPFYKIIGNGIDTETEPYNCNTYYNYSKIVPCPHRDKEWLGNLDIETTNLSPRVFEVPLSGTFQLVSGNRKNVINQFFEKDEVVLYDSATDFIEKATYYLEHEEERNKITEKARKKVLNNHTYIHRAQEVLKYIS